MGLIVVALSLVGGCAGSTASQAGDATSTADTAPAPVATFTEIFDLLFPANTGAKCLFCHSMPASQVSNGNLSMGQDKASVYAALVGQVSASTGCAGKTLVTPGHPEGSLLLTNLLASPPCGRRMPLGATPLPDATIEMIRGWIAAGAKND